MPLHIELEASPPNKGVLVVAGLPEAFPELLIAVQRLSDARYLTAHGLWVSDIGWYPCPRLVESGGDDAVRFKVAPKLVAAILTADTPLQAHVRQGDFADSGPLVVRSPDGSALGGAMIDQPNSTSAPLSGKPEPFAASGPQEAPLHPGPDAICDKPEPPWDELLRESAVSPHPGPAPGRHTRHSRRWASMLVGLVTLSAVALVAWVAGRHSQITPPAPTGKALFLSLKQRNLSPAALFEHAEEADRRGDCEAAVRLFIESAKDGAELADRLGVRYDPAGFAPTPCFSQPKPDSAIVWYHRAAEQSIPHAQRRYGELLLPESSSGPLYREALDWLHKAAAAGDKLAAQRLDALGER